MPPPFLIRKHSRGPGSVVQVLIAGGSSEWCAQYDTPASNISYLVDVTPGANHTPAMEEMTYRRVVRSPTIVHMCNGTCCDTHTYAVTHSAHHNQCLEAYACCIRNRLHSFECSMQNVSMLGHVRMSG